MIICFGREFGSGGHEIAKNLAGKLHLSLYDNELLEKAVEKDSVYSEVLKDSDEKKPNSWLYHKIYDGEDEDLRGLSTNDFLFQKQSQMILEYAEQDNCIFVGRCADYVLSMKNIHHISIFISAPFTQRVARKKQLLNLDEKKTVALVRKKDKQRKSYYDFYTGRNWGKPHNYDLCVNSFALDLDSTAKFLSSSIFEMECIKNGK